MNHEELFSKIESGKTAGAILNFVEPILAGFEFDLVTSLKTSFRTGNYTELVLACHTAQLCAIDDLRQKLTSMQRTGETSHTQIENGEYDDGE